MKNKKKLKSKKLSKEFINFCKKKLLEKYNELKNLNYINETNILKDVGDEIDQAGYDLGKEIFHELSDTQKNLLDLITLSLEKIDKKTYGLCEKCGCIISKKRLEILPWAKYCIKCQTNTDKIK